MIKSSIDKVISNRSVVAFFSLLISGVVSVIGFVLVASRKIIVLDSNIATFLILFAQWQTLGLTVAKVGGEHLIFALITENDQRHVNIIRYVIRKVVPLAFIFSIVASFIFSIWSAVVILITVILDSYSLLIFADLNGRKLYKITSLSNLLNYPLFFMLLYVSSRYFDTGQHVVLLLFLISSVARWVYLIKNRPRNKYSEEIYCSASWEMGAQQILNHLLFRMDQLLLILISTKLFVNGGLDKYLYLAKFPEIIAGVAAILGVIIFPYFYIKYPIDLSTLMTKSKYFVLAYFLFVFLLLLAYCTVSKNFKIGLALFVPFLFQSFLILIVNNLTYSMLRQGFIKKLIFNLAFSVIIGIVFLLSFYNLSFYIYPWLVPVQLFAFCLLSFIFSWGEHQKLYAKA